MSAQIRQVRRAAATCRRPPLTSTFRDSRDLKSHHSRSSCQGTPRSSSMRQQPGVPAAQSPLEGMLLYPRKSQSHHQEERTSLRSSSALVQIDRKTAAYNLPPRNSSRPLSKRSARQAPLAAPRVPPLNSSLKLKNHLRCTSSFEKAAASHQLVSAQSNNKPRFKSRPPALNQHREPKPRLAVPPHPPLLAAGMLITNSKATRALAS